jgi:hypothetical protein
VGMELEILNFSETIKSFKISLNFENMVEKYSLTFIRFMEENEEKKSEKPFTVYY